MRQLYSRIKKNLYISASVGVSVMVLAGCAELQGASEDSLQLVQQQREIALEPVAGIAEVKDHLAMMLSDDVLIYAESSECEDEDSGIADANSECADEELENLNGGDEIVNSDSGEREEDSLTTDERIVNRMNNIANLKDYDNYTGLPVYTK